SDALQLPRNQPDFLFALAPHRVFRRFTFIDATGRHFPKFFVDAPSILTNQNHLSIAAHRDDDDGRTVSDDGDLMFRAVRKTPPIDLDGKNATFEDDSHEGPF